MQMLLQVRMLGIMQGSHQSCAHILLGVGTHLCFSHIEEASASGTSCPSQSTHLPPGEPYVASNQQDCGR